MKNPSYFTAGSLSNVLVWWTWRAFTGSRRSVQVCPYPGGAPRVDFASTTSSVCFRMNATRKRMVRRRRFWGRASPGGRMRCWISLSMLTCFYPPTWTPYTLDSNLKRCFKWSDHIFQVHHHFKVDGIRQTEKDLYGKEPLVGGYGTITLFYRGEPNGTSLPEISSIPSRHHQEAAVCELLGYF